MEENTLQLLILSMGDSRYGIDVDQIAYLMNFDSTVSTVSFGQLIVVGSFVEHNYSKMLLIKDNMKVPILISEPDEVVTVLVSDICKLPDILVATAGKKGVWGIWPQEDGIIILIDFIKIKSLHD